MQKVPDDWEGRLAWLKDQARQSYVWNKGLGYWEVKTRWHYEGHAPYIPTPVTERLRDAFQYEATWHQNHPSLVHHRALKQWHEMQPQMQKRIAGFFEERNLHDFDFFDHGGWAIVFRARDRENGRYRIARMEVSPGEESRMRVVHPTVLPVYATNQDELSVYEDLKLEIMPEILPLHKLPGRPASGTDTCPYESYRSAVYEIGRGTNLTYDPSLFDEDCESHNVALLPDGKIVVFDTRFAYDEKAAKRFKRTEIRQDIKPYTDRLYGMSPNANFF